MKQTPFITAQARRLVAELRRDRRRLAVLVVLLVIGVGLMVRAVIPGGPSPAHASPKRSMSVAAATPSVSAEALRTKHADQIDYISRINRNQTRDLFHPNEVFFPLPRAVVKKTKAVVVPSSEPSKDLEQELQRRRVEQDAQSLKLQSTMFGARTVASISGHTLAVGDQIGEFRVTDIQSSSCTVEKNGVSVVLTISP